MITALTASAEDLLLMVPHRLPPSRVKPIPYPGSKARDVANLAAFLPYTISSFHEVCCGSPAFTFHLLKEKPTKIGRYSLGDVNPNLINFLQVLRDDAEALTLQLLALQQSHGLGNRPLFERAIHVLNAAESEPLAKAVAYYVAVHGTYGGRQNFLAGNFCAPEKSGKGLKRDDILLLPLFGRLLNGVAIHRQDYKLGLAAAAAQGWDALAFVDAPYTGSERSKCFGEHTACLDELADQCRAVADQCKLMITLDDCPANRARFKGFNIISRKAWGMAADTADELLILNYEPPLQTYWLAQTGWQAVGDAANDNSTPPPAGTPPLPDRRYQVILADPPWPYYGSPTKAGAAGKHYQLMTLNDIKALNVRSITDKRAVCFMWCTSPMLQHAADVFRAWGFNYNNVAWVWAKTRKDGELYGAAGPMPSYVKTNNVEYLLIGSTKRDGKAPWSGIAKRGARMIQLVREPKGSRHSQKPDVFYDLVVDLVGDRPRIELFARQRVAGWDAWGNEVAALQVGR